MNTFITVLYICINKENHISQREPSGQLLFNHQIKKDNMNGPMMPYTHMCTLTYTHDLYWKEFEYNRSLQNRTSCRYVSPLDGRLTLNCSSKDPEVPATSLHYLFSKSICRVHVGTSARRKMCFILGLEWGTGDFNSVQFEAGSLYSSHVSDSIM